jgi:predicted metal-dependent phosphoesterase TrpH
LESKQLKADLHVHTTASDGRLSPSDLVTLAAKQGITVLAITDHDTLDGYFLAKPEAEKLGMLLIPAVEITTNFDGRECHLLAYDVDTNNQGFIQFLAIQRTIRKSRATAIVERLNKMGFDLEMDEVRAESGKATISRNHIAAAMQRKNIVATKREAFDRYLHSKGPAYVQNEYPDVLDVISMVRDIGGVSVLAHPGKSYIFQELKLLKDHGLDGLEYLHPSHTWALQKKYKDYALNYGMLLTGGSDFHGTRAHEVDYLGTVCVDLHRVDALLERASQRKKLSA